jgi:hypothetical protein
VLVTIPVSPACLTRNGSNSVKPNRLPHFEKMGLIGSLSLGIAHERTFSLVCVQCGI